MYAAPIEPGIGRGPLRRAEGPDQARSGSPNERIKAAAARGPPARARGSVRRPRAHSASSAASARCVTSGGAAAITRSSALRDVCRSAIDRVILSRSRGRSATRSEQVGTSRSPSSLAPGLVTPGNRFAAVGQFPCVGSSLVHVFAALRIFDRIARDQPPGVDELVQPAEVQTRADLSPHPRPSCERPSPPRPSGNARSRPAGWAARPSG